MSEKPTRQKPARRGLFTGTVQLIAVIGITFGTMLIANYMKNNQPERVQVDAEIFVPVVKTHTVRTGPRVVSVDKTGSVEPSVYVSITPGVSGVVEQVAAGMGDGAVFGADEILFHIAREDLEIEVQRREADLAGARASLDIELAQGENARREWESFGRGEITDLAARGPQIRQAEAQVLTSQASLNAALLDLERSGFSLPFDGRVVDISLAQGQKVTEGQSYGTVYGFDAVEVTVSLSPDELALLDTVIGTKAEIQAQVLGRETTLNGQISRVSGEVDRATRLTDLTIALDPQEVRQLQLQPGTFVQVSLAGPEYEDVAEIPNAAMQDGDLVWLVEDNMLQQRPVNLILRGRETSLVTGLDHGMAIGVGTISGAVDGMSVRPESVETQQGSAQ